MKSTHTAVLVLHDIRSAQNVGSLLRTADAAGISEVYLSSITPQPLDRFGRVRSDIAKTALGAQLTMPWQPYDDIGVLINELKGRGFKIVAIEQSTNAIDYKQVMVEGPTAFILGNEVGGIAPEVLSLVDTIAVIPMKGKKESLNVAVAGGIALYRILNI